MRRCTKLECLIECSKLLLQYFFIIACDLKGLDHDVNAVVTDCSGRKLYSIADNIVLICQYFQRILI